MSPEPSCLRFGICLFANNGGYKGIQKGGKRGVLKMVPFFSVKGCWGGLKVGPFFLIMRRQAGEGADFRPSGLR